MVDEKYIIKALKKIMGEENVITAPEKLETYACDGSFVKSLLPLCAARPGDVEEVQAIVRLANREQVALFLFSSGTTFQGAHIPTEVGITVDLRRLNRIELIDTVARNAIIEPGVTFAQLAAEAKKVGLKPMTPVGVPETASVLATYLEHTPLYLWPRYKTWETLTVKMVMPTGEILGTGQMALSASDRPYHWATNFAVINRLFFGAQGTLGIGVQAAVTLKNINPDRKFLFVALDNIDKLGEMSQALMRQEVNDEFFVVDRQYLACMLAKNKAEIKALCKVLPPWTLVIGISGSMKKELTYKELDIQDVLERFGLKADENLSGVKNIQQRLVKEIDHPAGMLNQRRYMGGCSYIACMASKTQVKPFYDLTLKAASQNGNSPAELGWMIMPLNFGGSYYFEPNLYYRNNNKKNSAEAKAVFKHISHALIQAGAFFPRPYPMWAEEVYSKMGVYHRKVKMLKELYDPNNIMNPGKLALR